MQEKILLFYKNHGRDLPWRKTTDPYKILVSEIMLQQTQVSRVIIKYSAWIKKYPSPRLLADAPLSEVLALWEGLGYNNRAKRLHDACKIIAQNGFPKTIDGLEKLPGIGPYTARSILIFAKNYDIATVDTNIRRILISELGLSENISEKELFEKAQNLLPKGRSREWHNALMDYGALVLTSKSSGIKPTTKQSKFEGSVRQYRAKILDDILENGSLTVKEAEEKYKSCPKPVRVVLDALVKDGLVRENEGVWVNKF